jgi:Cu-processing system permease protein
VQKLTQLSIVIQKEFLQTIRNRWLQGFVLAYLILSLTIGANAHFESHALDVATLHRIDISLLNLSLFLVPLISLIVSSQNIVTEAQEGFLELLSVYPVSSYVLMFGKYLGIVCALAAGILIGFGTTAVALAFFTTSLALVSFFGILAANIAVSGAFVGIGLAISSYSKTRGGALTTAILAWLASVLLYDLVVMQVIVSLQGYISQLAFNILIALNPIDISRLLLTHWLGLSVEFGTSTGSLETVVAPHLTFMLIAAIVWMAVPLFICRRKNTANSII